MSLPNGQPSAQAGADEEELLYGVEDGFWDCTEPLEDYKPGGFHPIILGDRLGDNGRFRVVHKLGHGGYGTVWLCQDTLPSTPKWRAVKVMSAKTSTPDCADLRAMEAFRGIESLAAENALHVSTPLEHFWIDGPNGRHLALVFALCAANAKYLGTTYGHNRALIKDLCFQLAKSLEFIHSRGLCHGDFRPSNILLRLCDGADALPEETLFKAFYNGGKPRTGRIISLEDGNPVTRASTPSVPEHMVGSVAVGFHSGLCAASLAVTDFGVSYSILDPPKEGSTGIPLDYASPEDRFFQRELLGPPSDIWALGCCINYLAANFTHFAQSEEGDDGNTHAARLESLLGPMPNPFRAAYKEEHKQEPKLRCFNSEVAKSDETNAGELKHITEIPPTNPFEESEKKMAAEMAEKTKRRERVMTPGEAIFRRSLQRTLYLSQTREEADLMKKQYELWHSQQYHNNKKTAHTLQLPYSEKKRNSKNMIYDDDDDDEQMELRVDDEEADLLFDLLMSIFKWHPKDRATIEEVLNHPWFEGRNQHAAMVSPPATGNKSVVGEALEGVKSYLHIDSAFSLLSGRFP